MSTTSELTHLFRALKAPAAARALPKPAERSSTSASSTSWPGKENVVPLRPPGTGKTHLSIALGIRACLAGQRVAFRTAAEGGRAPGRRAAPRRLDDELTRLQRIALLIVDEVGDIPFDPRPPT